MKSQAPSFAQLLEPFRYHYDLRTVFEDFLTMSLCAVTQNPLKAKSHYEDLYLQTIAPYKNDELRHQFPKAFARLVHEMETGLNSGSGNDVLGEYYQQNFYKKHSAQYFTPWPVCEFMARCTLAESRQKEGPLRVIDPTCGSGRMILAGAKVLGPGHEYYGIDLDHTCVKMAALNLFLNGVFGSEVMCADALMPGSFRCSYKISFLPFGIFRIEDRERSALWHSYNATFKSMAEPVAATSSVPEFSETKEPSKGQQLRLF